MIFDIKKKTRLSMRGNIMIPQKAFRSIVKLNEEFDSIIETIEIMNDKELMKGIEMSRRDLTSREREIPHASAVI